MWPRQRKHTQLVKASWNRVLLEYLRLVLGDKASNKMKLIPMANDTTKTRMNELPDSIKGQVVSKILSSPFFVLQLDESTDVANIAQLLVYCSYITTKVFKQDFLSCRALQTTTKGDDVIAVLTGFFKVTGLVGPILLTLRASQCVHTWNSFVCQLDHSLTNFMNNSWNSHIILIQRMIFLLNVILGLRVYKNQFQLSD